MNLSTVSLPLITTGTPGQRPTSTQGSENAAIVGVTLGALGHMDAVVGQVVLLFIAASVAGVALL